MQSATISFMKYLFEFGVNDTTWSGYITLDNFSTLFGHQEVLE